MAKKEWPRWMYGPGDESRIFNEGDTIPVGWKDHPSKVRDAEKPTEKPGTQPSGPTSVLDGMSIEDVEKAFADGEVTLDEIEKVENARAKPRQGILTLIENERTRISEHDAARGEAFKVLRDAGVDINDDATDDELDAALADIEEQQG